MSSVGPWESVGGDIKFLRLKQLGLGDAVTDGSVRDTDEIRCTASPASRIPSTPRQGPAVMQPGSATVLFCGGVAVRPGDCIVGDQDGVVVVPAAKAEMVYSIAHGREVIEEIVKEELTKNPGPRAASSVHVGQDQGRLAAGQAPRHEGHHAGRIPTSSRARRTW